MTLFGKWPRMWSGPFWDLFLDLDLERDRFLWLPGLTWTDDILEPDSFLLFSELLNDIDLDLDLDRDWFFNFDFFLFFSDLLGDVDLDPDLDDEHELDHACFLFRCLSKLDLECKSTEDDLDLEGFVTFGTIFGGCTGSVPVAEKKEYSFDVSNYISFFFISSLQFFLLAIN